ncbi:B3 domain-containing protein [Hordeum vulgare]|nr:B3 domain-containing protein [Hordeum vulgare]
MQDWTDDDDPNVEEVHGPGGTEAMEENASELRGWTRRTGLKLVPEESTAADRARRKLLVASRPVIDLGLEVTNSVIEPGEVLPDVIGIDLVLVGELRDHHVVGVESVFHHPLALEDLLVHCFEPRLHASGLLGPLNMTDVQHPLTHLDRLRVLRHARECCFSYYKWGGGRRSRLRSATPSEMADLEGIEFFTIILEKSSSRQVLPHNFVKMLDGHRPQNMKLRQAGNGLRRLWDVEVVFDTDGSMYLDQGWKHFVRAYDQRHGYFLVFRYDGNYVCTVKVFDTTMCRRRYHDDDDASNGSRSSDSGYSNRFYSKSSSDSSYRKSSSDSSYSNNSNKDEEEQSGEEEEQSRDDEVVADDVLAMVVVPDDDLATVVVPDDDLAMVVVPDDGLAMVIPQLGDRTMPIVVEEYIPRPGLGLRRSKRIRMMKEKGKKQ